MPLSGRGKSVKVAPMSSPAFLAHGARTSPSALALILGLLLLLRLART